MSADEYVMGISEAVQKPNVYVHVAFDCTGNKEMLPTLFKIQELFNSIGIGFDTGYGGGVRDWEWDWSLRGPVKVTLSGVQTPPDHESDGVGGIEHAKDSE